MRVRGHALAPLIAAVAIGGCSSGTERVPSACIDDPPVAFERALARAPAPVRVGGVRISSCFARRSDTAALVGVGTTLVAVASELSARARAHPHSHALTELGYLIGAARRGAARTEGIHYTLLGRLEQEPVGLDGDSAYARGVRAGERFG